MKIGAFIIASEKRRLTNRSLLVRFTATIALVIGALACTEVLWVIVDRPISSPLFLAAIVLSSWLCGWRYGIFAALLGGFAIDLFFVPPFFAFTGDRDEVIRILVFLFEGTVASWLVESLGRAGEEVITSREELRALTEYQQTLREAEQKRIALEIHDELGQSLTGLKMNVHLLKRGLKPPRSERENELSEGLDDLAGKIDSTISTVRRIASELRPSLLDDFGLLAAIEWQAQEFERRTSIPCELNSDTEDLELGADSDTAVYRIFQEALTNVARHADASSVRVDLKRSNGNLVMKVIDDGRGISRDGNRPRSLGIIGMQERSRLIGGELSIFSKTNGGTIVELSVPVGAAAATRGGS